VKFTKDNLYFTKMLLELNHTKSLPKSEKLTNSLPQS